MTFHVEGCKAPALAGKEVFYQFEGTDCSIFGKEGS
jgi:hypothetical protein